MAVVALAIAAALVACGGSDAPSAGGTSTKQYRVVYIPGVVGDDFFHTIWVGAQEEAKRRGVEIEQRAPSRYEPAAQIPVLNAAIAERPDAIAIAATDENALQGPLQRAAQLGIKVILFDTTVEDPSFAVTHVSSDIAKAGRRVGRELLALTQHRGKLLYIDHAPGVSFAEDLRRGFEAVVNGDSNARLLPVRYFELEPKKATTIVRTTLARHPDLAGAFVGVGTGADGAVVALRASHKLGKVKTVAFDAFASTIEYLKQGEIDAVVSVGARQYGVEIVKAARNALEGKDVPPRVEILSCTLTRANVDDPANAPCLYEPAPKG